MADHNETRDWRNVDEDGGDEHHGGAEHGYGQGGKTAFGQIANGGSDMAGRGFGGSNTGGFGQQTQNSQWGQGGMGPMTQGANYSQGGGRFGPAGYDRSSDRSGYGSHDSHSADRRDEQEGRGRDYGRGQMDRDRFGRQDAGRQDSGRQDSGRQDFGRQDYGPSGQTAYGSSEQRGYGQNVFDRGDLAQPSRPQASGQSPYGSSQGQGYGQNRPAQEGGDDRRSDPRGPRADNPGDYGRADGTYGQQDYGPAAQRSNFRIDQHSAQPGDVHDNRQAGGDHDDHEPHYRTWRESQLTAHDRDYARWRSDQERKYDEDYRGWRHERHSAFSKEFEGWRSGLGGQAGASSSTGASEPKGSQFARPGVSPGDKASEQAGYGQGLSGASHRATQGVGSTAVQADATAAATSPVLAPESSPTSGSTAAASTSGSFGQPRATDNREAVDSTLTHGANPTLGAIADGTTGSHRDLPHADHEARKDEQVKAKDEHTADHSA